MIYHLEDIDKIREIENQVALKTKNAVIDISHWDSGKEYHEFLTRNLNISITGHPFDYIYSYELPNSTHLSLKKKLNIIYDDYSTIVFPSSTLSIVNLANFFQKYNLNNVCILQPSYFTIEPCLNTFGINVHNISIQYKNNKFHIPINEILSKNFDVVWLTSPLFGSSVYFDDVEYYSLKELLNNNIFVICDESLSDIQKGIHSYIQFSDKLLTIHSPHKVLGTNALKFSFIVCHKKYLDFFNKWSDIFSGGLTLSSHIAIEHFLSSNYDFCLEKSLSFIAECRTQIEQLLEQYEEFITWSKSQGQYMTIFCPFVPYTLSTKYFFIKNLIENTNVSLLPGYLEGYLEEFGFCFRINLLLNKNQLLLSLNEVLNYLKINFL